MKYAKYDRHEYMHVDNSVCNLRIDKRSFAREKKAHACKCRR
jgi:hypothetical protein